MNWHISKKKKPKFFTKKYLKVTSEINDNNEIKDNSDSLVIYPKEEEKKDNLVNISKEEEKLINTIIKKQQLELLFHLIIILNKMKITDMKIKCFTIK